jgi:aminopeptidase N
MLNFRRSRTVKRVEDVSLLRTAQFAEDAGPMAHPIRPDSFIEISNFYTVTIYEKGAEVVRMIAHLLGAENFRKGSDLYFDRHDGQAVTCEDFVKAMEDASGIDLTQFRNWYSQAGTPELTMSGEYDAENQRYCLSVEQRCPATPGQKEKAPFHIPVLMSLLGKNASLPLKLMDQPLAESEMVLNITEAKQQFIFENISEEPVPSLLRGFSAPVKFSFNYSREQLMFIMSRDTDGFCRWNAAQQLGVSILNDMVSAYQQNNELVVDPLLIEAYKQLLLDKTLDKAMVALMLNLPTEAYMAEISPQVDVHAIHAARVAARHSIAKQLQPLLLATYHENTLITEYQPSAEQIAQRSLKNACLSYLMLLEDKSMLSLCVAQFESSNNMTDTMQAFVCLLNSNCEPEKEKALQQFYARWENEPLVINQWFMAQATCALPGTLDKVKQLMDHSAFDIKNPNKVRALIGAFCGQNAINFHQQDGAGYRFLADQIILLNALNPQIASRLLGPLIKWKKYLPSTQILMKTELERIKSVEKLSKDVYEVVSKSLSVD